MVVLTIVTQKNGETIFFDEPIPEVNFMKLISCSLYNSWDTLKREGSAELGFKKRSLCISWENSRWSLQFGKHGRSNKIHFQKIQI